MFATRAFAAAALALGLALSGPAFAATEQAHASHGAGVLELAQQRSEMADRRGAAPGHGRDAEHARNIARIHAGQFTTADYATLADRVQEQVDYVTANCKLPEEADRQLHVVLGAILEGVDAMRAGADRLQGARRVVLALEAYGRHFNHPNWTPAVR